MEREREGGEDRGWTSHQPVQKADVEGVGGGEKKRKEKIQGGFGSDWGDCCNNAVELGLLGGLSQRASGAPKLFLLPLQSLPAAQLLKHAWQV